MTARRAFACERRVADGPRNGRPRTALGIIDPWSEQVIAADPRALGDQSTVWTAPLLQQYLEQGEQCTVSTKSGQRTLSRLRIVWKRPRHPVALQDPYWRRAKGG